MIKRIKELRDLTKRSELTKKVLLYFTRLKTAEEGYDGYEENYVSYALNPLTVKAIVVELSPEKVAYKKYGQSKAGSIEIIADIKYTDWFKRCIKIEVDGIEYVTYKDSVGDASIISARANNIVKVACQRK